MHPPSTCSAVALWTAPGIGAKDFNVGEYLIDRTSPIASAGETWIDQYGLMFEQVVIHPRKLNDKDYSPLNLDAGRKCPSIRMSPICQPSPIEEDVEYDQDVDMQSQLQVTFYLQEMDMEAQQPNRRLPSPDVMDRSYAPVEL